MMNDDKEKEDETLEIIENDELKKINLILSELQTLGKIANHLNENLNVQTETIENLESSVVIINQKIEKISNQLQSIIEKENKISNYNYVKDYLFPLIPLLGAINYKLFYIFGLKGGIMVSSFTYLLWKAFSN